MSGLDNVEYLLIEQRPDWLECFCPACCEIANEYSIFLSDAEFNKTDIRELGKMTETSGCLCRLCCRFMRSFNMEVAIEGAERTHTDRPFKCPMACICRPIINVNSNRGELGQVFQHYIWCLPCCRGGCCSMQEIDIKDASGNVIYMVTGPCCQAGVLCMCVGCLGPCKKIEYKILDANKEHVGSIYRIYNDLLLAIYTKADKFGIKFPADSDVEKKLLIVHAAMFLDYLQFGA